MFIIDENNLLTHEEHEAYHKVLKDHTLDPQQFLVKVTEDQESVDMNDIDYVIFLEVKVTHTQNNISNTYFSRLGSHTWIAEFETDLNNGYFLKRA